MLLGRFFHVWSSWTRLKSAATSIREACLCRTGCDAAERSCRTQLKITRSHSEPNIMNIFDLVISLLSTAINRYTPTTKLTLSTFTWN